MRHRKKFNHLGRKSAHRQETLSSMATALIINKRINTTVAKAKALRVYVEPLITKSKTDSTHSRRVVFGYLGNKHAVSELFREVAQKVADRPGGYTRILKTGFRKGDGAEMCFIELVDYNANMLKSAEDTQQKRTRRSRRGRKAGEADVAETPKADKKGKETPAAAPAEKPETEDAVETSPKAEAIAEETSAAKEAVDEVTSAAEEVAAEETPDEEAVADEPETPKAPKAEKEEPGTDDAASSDKKEDTEAGDKK